MRSSEAWLNGHLPSKACRTMPSSKSPSVRSWYSAKAFKTFTRRFSIRTPVCTRSTSRGLLSMRTKVPRYHIQVQGAARILATSRANSLVSSYLRHAEAANLLEPQAALSLDTARSYAKRDLARAVGSAFRVVLGTGQSFRLGTRQRRIRTTLPR